MLQREVFPSSLVADLTGVGASQMTEGWDTSWPIEGRPDSFAAIASTEAAIYLQAMLLPDVDTFSMASSVEVRVPFVDGPVISAALMAAQRNNRAPGKAAIGAALSDSYLETLAARPKRGFSLPMGPWLSGPLAPLVASASEPQAPVWSVVDRARAEQAGLASGHSRPRWAETWALTALNAWLEAWAEDAA